MRGQYLWFSGTTPPPYFKMAAIHPLSEQRRGDASGNSLACSSWQENCFSKLQGRFPPTSQKPRLCQMPPLLPTSCNVNRESENLAFLGLPSKPCSLPQEADRWDTSGHPCPWVWSVRSTGQMEGRRRERIGSWGGYLFPWLPPCVAAAGRQRFEASVRWWPPLGRVASPFRPRDARLPLMPSASLLRPAAQASGVWSWGRQGALKWF